MQQLTHMEFMANVKTDPAWASKLTEPTEIIGFCDLEDSPITHLSPLLHFKGRDLKGKCATFNSCKNLKTATGTFDGLVDFSNSGIHKIHLLTITQPDSRKNAAYFKNCENLKVAEGSFPYFVDFSRSGITEVGNLKMTHQRDGIASAIFEGCQNLIKAPEAMLSDHHFCFSPETTTRIRKTLKAKTILKNQPELEI